MSSTYVSFVGVPLTPPNTTALWQSILVKVWKDSGGGFSPVVGCTAHTSAGTQQSTVLQTEFTISMSYGCTAQNRDLQAVCAVQLIWAPFNLLRSIYVLPQRLN